MKSNKPLMAKTPLKAKAILKASVKPKKQKTPTITLLRRKADKLFSQYVRLRDSERREDGFYGKCITCAYARQVAWFDETGALRFNKGWDAGHYISRGNLYLRYDEENVNLQDSFRCNRMRSGEIDKYRLELDKKYGDGTAKKLEMAAAINRNYHLNKQELEEIIHNCTVAINFYKEQPMR